MSSDQLVHVEAIRVLKAKYFRLLDQRLWSDWAELFTDDVRVDVRNDSGRIAYGRDDFAPHVESMLAGVISVHHGHMAEITITGLSTAIGIWSMEDFLEFPPGGPIQKLWGTGWYEEQYRLCDDGAWRIADMILRRQRVEIDGVRVFPPQPKQE